MIRLFTTLSKIKKFRIYRTFVIYVSFLFAFLFHHPGFSQKIRPGILAGVTKTGVDGFPQQQDFGREQTKIGLLFGGLAQVDLSKKFELEWQIRYSEKGIRKGINPDHNDYVTWKVRLNYMEAPLILTMGVWKHFQVSVGISIGGLVLHKLTDPDHALADSLKNISYNRFELSSIHYLVYKFNHSVSLFVGMNYSVLPIQIDAKPIPWNMNGRGDGFYNLCWNFGIKYILEKEPNKLVMH